MIWIEEERVYNWEAAVRGMRNAMNSWDKSDSGYMPVQQPPCNDTFIEYVIGKNDLKLMRSLVKSGSDHRKFMRSIIVSFDIIAPLYWWKEYDTYKVGTVALSCSTMHKIHAKEFVLDDFSHERMTADGMNALLFVIDQLNRDRTAFIETKDKDYWDDMIQLLPSSYNQRRTVTLNYENLLNMYHARKNHKLKEWRMLCDLIAEFPYFREICLQEGD